jgi:hypothetical protein
VARLQVPPPETVAWGPEHRGDRRRSRQRGVSHETITLNALVGWRDHGILNHPCDDNKYRRKSDVERNDHGNYRQDYRTISAAGAGPDTWRRPIQAATHRRSQLRCHERCFPLSQRGSRLHGSKRIILGSAARAASCTASFGPPERGAGLVGGPMSWHGTCRCCIASSETGGR